MERQRFISRTRMEKHHVDSSRIDNVRDIEKKKEPSENAGGSISMLKRIR